MTAVQHAAAHDEVDRNLAFLTYGLLFFSIFFAGLPALIAVAIAYARKREADPLVRGHHAFQIVIFWVGFLCALLAGAAGLSAVLMAAGKTFALMSQNDGWRSLPLEQVIGPGVMVFLALFLLFGCVAALWVAITSVYGFLRLASLRPMGQTRS